ncbi:MAG: TAXI family TRAP transporter solute-binding subunit [Gemmataceae bacterium]
MSLSRRWYLRRDLAAAVLGVLALGLAAFFIWRTPDLRSHQLKISAGRASGQRYQIARMLADEARRFGLELDIVDAPGSEAVLDMVNEGKLDVALVQGGLDQGTRNNIRQVASLHVEPLHLLVKAELFEKVSHNLGALKGKVVNLSEPGSGTHTLSFEVLRFAGLRPARGDEPGDFKPATLGYSALLAEQERDKLPDAAFMVQSLPSPVARELVARQNYRVVPLTFAEAFALDAFTPEKHAGVAHRVEHVHVYDAVIPAFTYGVEPAVPDTPVHSLGTRLLVVANKNVDALAIDRLLTAMFNSGFVQISKPPLSEKLLELPPEFAWHAGTELHLERVKPIIAADVVDYSEKVLAIAATVLGGLFFLWQALRQWHGRRQEQGFRNYLVAVSHVEQRALELERSAALDLRVLLRLQRELNQIKDEVLRKFASGEVQGELLVSGFLTLVNDARNYITRLLLHERQNLEQQAVQVGRSVDELWRQALADTIAPTPRELAQRPIG